MLRKQILCLCFPVDIDSIPEYEFGQYKIGSGHVFYRSALSFAFVNIKPVLPGHILYINTAERLRNDNVISSPIFLKHLYIEIFLTLISQNFNPLICFQIFIICTNNCIDFLSYCKKVWLYLVVTLAVYFKLIKINREKKI